MEALQILQRIKEAYPHLRIGQIIGNVIDGYSELYYIDDERFAILLLELEEKLKTEDLSDDL